MLLLARQGLVWRRTLRAALYAMPRATAWGLAGAGSAPRSRTAVIIAPTGSLGADVPSVRVSSPTLAASADAMRLSRGKPPHFSA